MFMTRVHKVMTKLRFKIAEIWFTRTIIIMNILWTERKIINAMNVGKYKKIYASSSRLALFEDLHK